MQWAEWLRQHKRAANNDCLLILARNHNYQNLCLGWRNTKVVPPHGEIPAEEEPEKLAWKLCQYDSQELSAKSGIRAIEGLSGLVTKAAALGLIYPDGTINEAASKVLAAIITKELKALTKPPQS